VYLKVQGLRANQRRSTAIMLLCVALSARVVGPKTFADQ
jgi:hypothetical protein